jgi:DNA-binding NtrC family response regulator
MGKLLDDLAKIERRLINTALAQAHKDVARAAAKLGITVDELGQRARRLGITLVVMQRKTARKRTGKRPPTLREATRDLERRWMREALEASGGDINAAAESINMVRSTFYRRMEEFGMSVVPGKPGASRGRKRKDQRRDIAAAVEKLRVKLTREALAAAGGNRKAAAERLGVSRSTFHRKNPLPAANDSL